MSYKDELIDRLRDVIVNTCNTIGCGKCDLKWDRGCSAIELQNKIFDEEDNERKVHQDN